MLSVRLLHQHSLETPLQSSILFYVLAVFVHGGGADALEGASGKGRLKYVGRIHSPLGAPCPHYSVYLVYEQDHVLHRLNLFHQVLEPLLELPTELGSGHQRAHIYNHDALVQEHLGGCPLCNPMG